MSDADRRIFLRIPIDIPVFCEINFDSGAKLTVLLKDISRGGLQVALSPGSRIESPVLGEMASISRLPPRIGSGSIHSTITWQSPERLGLRFNEPLGLSDDELDAIMQDC